MIEQWQVSAPEERTGSPRGDWCTMALLLLELEILWLGSSFLQCLAITQMDEVFERMFWAAVTAW